MKKKTLCLTAQLGNSDAMQTQESVIIHMALSRIGLRELLK